MAAPLAGERMNQGSVTENERPIAVVQSHLLACALDAVPCPLNCAQQVSRLAADDHVRHRCPNRRQVCDHCRQELSGLEYDVSGRNLLLLAKKKL